MYQQSHFPQTFLRSLELCVECMEEWTIGGITSQDFEQEELIQHHEGDGEGHVGVENLEGLSITAGSIEVYRISYRRRISHYSHWRSA